MAVELQPLSATQLLNDLTEALPRLLSASKLHAATATAGQVSGFAAGVLRRLASSEARSLLGDAALFVLRAPPVQARRLRDVLAALSRLGWLRALREPRDTVAEVIATVLDSLGGTAVKLAQVISHSPYLPEALVAQTRGSLSNARCPVVPFDQVRAIVARTCGVEDCAELFSSLDPTPLAAASIAQVHAGTLRDGGARVVVKVVRPGVLERLTLDLDAVVLLARLADLLLGEDVVRASFSSALAFAAREVRRSVLAECDLVAERASMEEFREWIETSPVLFRAGLRGAVAVPRSYARCSGPEALTMELVEGRLLSDVLAARRSLARRIRLLEKCRTPTITISQICFPPRCARKIGKKNRKKTFAKI